MIVSVPSLPLRARYWYGATALTGLVICVVISRFTGQPLAWDSGYYFSVGMPLMAGVIYYCSYRAPQRPWRWTLSMALGQGLSAALSGLAFSALPVAVLVLMTLSIPQFVAGIFGARLSRTHGVP